MAETLANGTVIPQGSDPIHASGVQWGRNMGGSIDAQLGNRYTKAQADALLAGKAASSHTHALADVTGLAARLAALEHDTGWRDVSADLRGGATGILHVRRIGMSVHWRFRDLVSGVSHTLYWPPVGMRTVSDPLAHPPQATGSAYPFYLDANGILCRDRTAPALTAGRWWEGVYVLPAGTPPIASPPGDVVPA